jgi:predicted metal-binding protein
MVGKTVETGPIRKIVEKVPDEVLQQDLETYRQRALEIGATDAKIITTDMVVIDERVRAKCIHPKCEWYGTNIHCPPHAMALEDTRKLVNNFHYAIFIQQKLPTETLAGRRTPEQYQQYLRDTKTQLDILARVESEAFYDGYYLAVAFGGGPCKRFFCPDDECAALIPGQACRHPLYARASMEGVGMDAYLMATKVGWDIYPLGRSASPAPYGTRLGIVFIY